MKFLIDECLSPALAQAARERGFSQSAHVNWLGLAGRSDWSLVRRAVEDGFVLVTNNAVDFRPLFGREPLHGGLVCLNVAAGLMNLTMQTRLFALALDRLAASEPINEALEVTLDVDGTVTIERYDLS